MIGNAPTDAAAPVVARLVPLEPGVYAFRLAESTSIEAAPGLALPAVEVCAAPQQEGGLEVADAQGHPASWLGAGRGVLFVTARGGGATALVTGFLSRDPSDAPLVLAIIRIAVDGGDTDVRAARTLEFGGSAEAPEDQLAIDTVAHIRARGDVRSAAPRWVGRLGPGLWIEAITIVPRDVGAAAAIEYKGLAANGAETPWLASGSLCGSKGQGTPLVGFAMRQKGTSGGPLFDCEYTGYFSSGAVAGPMRNGAPCRSAVENDPLEGLQLRITPREPRR